MMDARPDLAIVNVELLALSFFLCIILQYYVSLNINKSMHWSRVYKSISLNKLKFHFPSLYRFGK